MAEAKDYFEQNTYLEKKVTWKITSKTDGQFDVTLAIAYAFEEGSKFLKIYIPECTYPDSVLVDCLAKLPDLWEKEKDVSNFLTLSGDSAEIEGNILPFSNRVIVYSPTDIGEQRWNFAINQLALQGFSVIVRDNRYIALRDRYDTKLAFISHDSRDKAGFVADLARTLQNNLCPVWYDEFTLKPGDSLRDSIEKGLRECPKVVVVLSKNFFSNPGWTKREFDTIYTREIIEGKRLMIPIWLDVSKQEVFDYSPILADTVGINAALGHEEVARRLMGVLNYQPENR